MYQLPQLPYDYADLEPVISAEIMHLHHQKHHQTYVTKLNEALEKHHDAVQKQDIAQITALESAIRFNGGGHINHSIFWTNLAPPSKGGGHMVKGTLLEKIIHQFGAIEKFIEIFSATSVGIQGSGWCWLGFIKSTQHLIIETCPNQDPLVTKGYIPLLGIDVWEHAYYPQYKNGRADYVKNIWNIVNWSNVQERFETALLK
jgi:Fe-Mn family superoxide dismutase